jgi:hypothetical protein
MKALRILMLAAVFGVGFYTVGCETSHTESDTPGLLGGNTHDETTTTKNPITGDTSVQHSEEKTN